MRLTLTGDIRVAGIRTEEEYFQILRNRVMWCICNRLQNNERTFHAIDMIQECAGGFYSRDAADEFQFRGNQEDYTHVLERIYNPLLEQGMLEEYENNNYRVPEGSLLEQICTRELRGGRMYIDFDNIVEFQG